MLLGAAARPCPPAALSAGPGEPLPPGPARRLPEEAPAAAVRAAAVVVVVAPGRLAVGAPVLVGLGEGAAPVGELLRVGDVPRGGVGLLPAAVLGHGGGTRVCVCEYSV